MYVAAALVVFMSLTATSQADHHHHCHSPNMTGSMFVATMKGEVRGAGAFTYDSMGNKLRFTSNESLTPFNTSASQDFLMFFKEGIYYEIDSKNQTCEKKTLHCSLHPLDVPDDAIFVSTMNVGNPFIEGEGIKINMWAGSLKDKKTVGQYSMSVTMGCLPLSALYFTEPTSFIVSAFDVENEVKDPDLLAVPPFCQGQPLEETPEGTTNSFLNEFM